MFNVELTVPFAAGLVAAVNPCGFAMLPAYLAYFLGLDSSASDVETTSSRNVVRGLVVSLTLTAGFVVFFGIIGALTTSLISTSTIADRAPWITLVLSGVMVLIGIAMLAGMEPKLSLPRLSRGGDSRGLFSMFLFGVSYAVVSVGCASPVFFGSVTSSFGRHGWFEGILRYLAYALGMGLIITTLTLGVAMGRSGITLHMRRLLPHINRISGGFLILAGVVLGFYGWWEVQVLLRGDANATNPFADASNRISDSLSGWVTDVGGNRLGLALGLLLVALLLWVFRQRIPQPQLGAAVASWVVAYLALELAVYSGDLLVLPLLRTVADVPERVGNWFTDPLRWPVMWELLAALLVALILWLRLRPSPTPTPTPEEEPAATT